GHPGDGGRDLCQHRRLRRVLLAGRRALGRPVRSASMADSIAPRPAPRGHCLVRGRSGSGAGRRGTSGTSLMRILIATDAWRPQVNGVVSTLERMTQAAGEFGAKFEFLTAQGMWTAPLPTYPEIRLAIPSVGRIGRRIQEAAPDHIHIATEGP